MSFRAKILAVLLVAAVVPLLVASAFSYRASHQELATVVGRLELETAEELARYTESVVTGGLENLRLAEQYIPFSDLGDHDLAAVLEIPYRQFPAINLLALVRSDGELVGQPVYRDHPERFAEWRGHEAIAVTDLELFSNQIPLTAALANGVAIGPPYRSPDGRSARLAIAVRTREPSPRLLTAELSLRAVEQRLNLLTTRGVSATLVDGRGRPFAPPLALAPDEIRLVEAQLPNRQTAVASVRRSDGNNWLMAFAPIPSLGWGVLVGEPAQIALASAERLKNFSLLCTGLAILFAAGLGFFLVRELGRPLGQLQRAALAMTEGQYSQQVAISGRDEIGALAVAFNHMSQQIDRRDNEIRTFNAELQQRVRERTADLVQAQDQVMRARRMAALASLGAGVAHELNNPMTAVMGLITLVRKEVNEQSSAGQTLGVALDQARRVVKVVDDLRQLVDDERQTSQQRFSIKGPVSAALAEQRPEMSAKQIQLDARFTDVVPDVQGDPRQIEQLASQLVQNAIAAMTPGGKLTVAISSPQDEVVKLTVQDTGRGIPEKLWDRIFDPFFSTKDEPGRRGLGLSISHTIVEAHHGKITVDSKLGEGSIFTVTLPAAVASGHLL